MPHIGGDARKVQAIGVKIQRPDGARLSIERPQTLSSTTPTVVRSSPNRPLSQRVAAISTPDRPLYVDPDRV
jgi:hypothetical protein